MKRTLLLLGLLTCLPVCGADRPNVILILADDFGYECVGAHGGISYQTPNLDKLAAGGMRFDFAYAQPLCTPTRVQLMTGQSNIRNYTHFGELEPSQTTFAHHFRKAGYVTGIAGKWQLGGGFEGPGHFGFDEYCLWQLTRRPSRYPNPGLEINGKEVDCTGGKYGPDVVNDYVLDFIARQKAKPFLLYYPMMLTHDPFVPTPDSAEWNPEAVNEGKGRKLKHFADMTAYMDKLVGSVVAALEKNGLREKTLILFTGDNGTGTAVTSKMGVRSVRGGKGSSKDNGIHVPLIANWPGTIAPGRVCNDMVDSTDYLPTMCAAAGISIPEGPFMDGRSFMPQLRGEPGQPREWAYCWYAREGGAKAQFEFAHDQRFKHYRDGRLYDLAADIDEQNPLPASENLDVRQKLQAGLDHFRDARPAAIAAQGGGKIQGKGKKAGPKVE
ncbi:MAG: sulfatase-like hydrolase/transferase [Prosthecobacter sp.]|nr:sulfatase-like hydrolase/transferase [Prosthecobacter sp.]